MSVFAHCEDGSVWRPRHPVVCLIDSLGFVTMLVLIVVYRPSIASGVLPVAIALQYAVSFMHHWLPYAEWRSKIDRGVIFVVIAATYVPYWSNLLPAEEAAVRLPFLGLVVIVGIVLVLLEVSENLIALYYAAFATAGVVSFYCEIQTWLPSSAICAFWVGSALYAVQQGIYVLKWPDPIPKKFGFREVQHPTLYVATLIGSVVALANT